MQTTSAMSAHDMVLGCMISYCM